MKETTAFHIMTLYRDFLAWTTQELKGLGLRFGQMPFLLYTGKHPGCTQADLTRVLKLDWGYSQRGIARLVEAGLIRKEYNQETGCNCLTLTEAGQNVFDACHRVFASWDQLRTDCLTAEEKETLLLLLSKITPDRKGS